MKDNIDTHKNISINDGVVHCKTCGLEFIDNRNEKDSLYRYAELVYISNKTRYFHTNHLPSCNERRMENAIS